jgi:NDP-sugar pyrophosphorylase family protein
MLKLKAAVIAAGSGDRLRRAGIPQPKPLVPIAGVPLIERVLGALASVDIEDVALILNARSESDAAEQHCRCALPHLKLEILRQNTPSSMESLFALAPYLQTGPFLLLTVDAIFGPRVLPALLDGWTARPNADGVLAVHGYIDDEKPLRVRVDSMQRITAIGSAASDSPLITAGLYLFTPRIFDEIAAARAAGYSALREFLSHLARHGYRLFARRVPKTVDVDRPEDILVAEQLVRGELAS